MNLPRVLFLSSEAPHTGAAGAILFQRLFRNYPRDRLRVITNHLPPPDAGRLDCHYEYVGLPADMLDRTRFWTWRTALRALGGPDWVPLGAIDDALLGFEPEIVVTLMQDSWYYDYAARYARQRGLPLVLFVHDLPDGFEPVASWFHRGQHRRDARVYQQAARRLCISEAMRAHFQEKFRVSGHVLPPPRAEDVVAQNPALCRELKHPGRLTLGYAGGLHYGYGEQMIRMLPALRAAGTTLELFCPPPGGVLAPLAAATDVVNFRGRAATPEAAWVALLASCDVVLQPYANPPGAHFQQYRTHFPSKLGDCLALGLPLLITGPEYATGVAWVTDHPGCALPVTSPDEAPLADALVRLREEPELRVQLATTAQDAAHAFDAAPLREAFHALLLDVLAAR